MVQLEVIAASSPIAVRRYANAVWVAAAPGHQAYAVRGLLARREAHHAMVFSKGDLVGVLCSCDLGFATPRDLIFELMSRRVITVESTASVWTASRIMSQTGVGCLPVTEGGQVVGMIDREQLLEAGIPLESSGPICGSCGTHRHVPLRTGGRPRMCIDCFDRAVFAPIDAHGEVEIGGSG